MDFAKGGMDGKACRRQGRRSDHLEDGRGGGKGVWRGLGEVMSLSWSWVRDEIDTLSGLCKEGLYCRGMSKQRNELLMGMW
jgi:hypothetical protein